jgi:hypothetical protein
MRSHVSAWKIGADTFDDSEVELLRSSAAAINNRIEREGTLNLTIRWPQFGYHQEERQ